MGKQGTTEMNNLNIIDVSHTKRRILVGVNHVLISQIVVCSGQINKYPKGDFVVAKNHNRFICEK